MSDVADPRDQFSAREDRRADRNIRQMVPASVVRVVHDEHIARMNIFFSEFPDNVLCHIQRCREKDRNAAFDLRYDVSVPVHDGDRIIPAFLDIGRICAFNDDRVGLISYGKQKVPDDLHNDRIHFFIHFRPPRQKPRSCWNNRLPSSPSAAEVPSCSPSAR